MTIVQRLADLTRKKRQNIGIFRGLNDQEVATYTDQVSRVKRQYMLIYSNTFENLR